MDPEEIKRLCDSIPKTKCPPDADQKPFNLSDKSLKALRAVNEKLKDPKLDEYTRVRLKTSYDQFLSITLRLRDLLLHKAALLVKREREGSAPELEIELAEVDNALKHLGEEFGKRNESMTDVVAKIKKPIQGPQRLVGDQHWAGLSQKAKLFKAVNKENE